MSASVHFNLSSQSNSNIDQTEHYSATEESNLVKNRESSASAKQRAMLKRSFSLVPERMESQLDQRTNICHDKVLRMCESILLIASIGFIIILFPFSLIFSLKVVAQYQRAVVFRLGKLIKRGIQGPGLIFILPCLDNMKRIDLRTLTFDVPTQEVLTRDSVTVAVDAVVYYRIFDPVMSVVNVEDANRSTRLLAQTTLRNVLGTVDLTSLLTDREDIAASMQEALDHATDAWGMKVERVEIKDVRLPQQLQRAMAAEAEAAREAGAKVIAAEGEQRASRALRCAAQELSRCPVALQLRYLQTLNSISAEKNSTIIFPLPVDVLSAFQSTHAPNPSHNMPADHPPYHDDSKCPPHYDDTDQFDDLSSCQGMTHGKQHPHDNSLHGDGITHRHHQHHHRTTNHTGPPSNRTSVSSPPPPAPIPSSVRVQMSTQNRSYSFQPSNYNQISSSNNNNKVTSPTTNSISGSHSLCSSSVISGGSVVQQPHTSPQQNQHLLMSGINNNNNDCNSSECTV